MTSIRQTTAIFSRAARSGCRGRYPIDPAQRARNVGSHVGEVIQRTGRWVLSSDVGCDLIFMDGLMHAATLMNDPQVDALCEEILARNLQIDLVGIQAQTHATLTGIRGMLRWAVHKRRPSLVTESEQRFRLYTDQGMSENYENWNWFGRPTHTEPCAVVDSLMVANELWRLAAQSMSSHRGHSSRCTKRPAPSDSTRMPMPARQRAPPASGTPSGSWERNGSATEPGPAKTLNWSRT